MFWEATAPTPALAWAHRAPTAGDEEEIATPNITRSEERATMERVTDHSSSGIMAMTSTSTSHSGRARAAITIPVDTG
jgi:hypothetical protein